MRLFLLASFINRIICYKMNNLFGEKYQCDIKPVADEKLFTQKYARRHGDECIIGWSIISEGTRQWKSYPEPPWRRMNI